MAVEYIEFDKKLCDRVVFDLVTQNTKIKFQFPPKITSDDRKGEWNEINHPGTEPVATYTRSGPREISLTFTYIVDGKDWTTFAVSSQVSNLRRYFSKYREQAGFRGLIVRFQMWYHGDLQPASCRIKGVSVKHSDTIVAPNNIIGAAYPLRTDVTVDLRLWTKGGPQATQDIEGLDPFERPGWY